MNDKWFNKVILGKEKPKRKDDGSYCPDRRDRFWVKGRGSGFVVWIDYTDKTVMVKYIDHSSSVYRWDEIEDKFTTRYGGIWIPDY